MTLPKLWVLRCLESVNVTIKQKLNCSKRTLNTTLQYKTVNLSVNYFGEIENADEWIFSHSFFIWTKFASLCRSTVLGWCSIHNTYVCYTYEGISPVIIICSPHSSEKYELISIQAIKRFICPKCWKFYADGIKQFRFTVVGSANM